MKKVLLVVCAFLLAASATWAAPVCTTNTLDNYIAQGGCTVNGVLFNMFAYNDTAGGGAATVPASAVQVTPITSGNTGLNFQGPWGVGANQTMDAVIDFNIVGTGISSDTLSMVGGSVGSGSAQVVESLCRGFNFASDGSCAGPVSSLSVNSSNPSASVSFAAVSDLGVVKNIILNGGSSPGSSAGVSVVINSLPGGGGGPGGGQIPEPVSFLTLGSGLIITALLLKRRVRKA